MPWTAAIAAVALKAALAWLPALALGGVSLVLTRRAVRRLATLAPGSLTDARLRTHRPASDEAHVLAALRPP